MWQFTHTLHTLSYTHTRTHPTHTVTITNEHDIALHNCMSMWQHTHASYTHATHTHTTHTHTHTHTPHTHTRIIHIHYTHTHYTHTLIHTHYTHTRYTHTHASYTHATHTHTVSVALQSTHWGDQTRNIWISRSISFPDRSCDWQALCLLTWKFVCDRGDSRENVLEILAVVIIWSPISSVRGVLYHVTLIYSRPSLL